MEGGEGLEIDVRDSVGVRQAEGPFAESLAGERDSTSGGGLEPCG